jgi:hypothetical protein
MSLLGPELVTNGNFADDTGWTLGDGWTIAGGAADFITASSQTGELRPTDSLSITAGRSYQVSFTVVIATAPYSNYVIDLGGTTMTELTGSGSVVETVVCGSSDSYLTFTCEGNPNGHLQIESVSVKELSTAAVIEEALFDALTFNSSVSSIVSSRVYPQIVPQDTVYPAIRYNQISGVREHTLPSTDNMVHSRFQIDSYGTNYIGGRNLADAVRSALSDYVGTVGTVEIQCIHLIEEEDYFSETVGTDQLRRYGKRQDYMIWYNE